MFPFYHSVFFWHFLSFLCHLLNLTSQIGCPPWLAVYPGLVTEAMITAPLEIHLTFSHVIDFFCSSSKTSVRNLGEVFDSSLNFDSHIKCTSRSFYFLLRNISKMRASFFELEQIVLVLVSLHMLWCPFTSLDKSSLSCLQTITKCCSQTRSRL